MAATSHTTARGPRNLAARMGRWSAAHRKLAVLSWLAFVLAALVLGGAVGTRTLGDADAQSGEAGRAAKLFAAAGLDGGDSESVLVQSRTLQASDPEFAATVRGVERASRASQASASFAPRTAEAAAGASRRTATRC
jgi:hypothetical protein